jgi:hypothetical protein
MPCCNKPNKTVVAWFELRRLQWHPRCISKLTETQGKISKDMVVQLVCVGIMMLFAAMWFLAIWSSTSP